MIPKPPFPCDVSPERELEEFRRLQPQLAELWNALSNQEEQPYTSVVVPSLTLDQRELEKLDGASYYEERLLFLLIRLRNPQARMVYVTSRPGGARPGDAIRKVSGSAEGKEPRASRRAADRKARVPRHDRRAPRLAGRELSGPTGGASAES